MATLNSPPPSSRQSFGWQFISQKPLAEPTTPFTGKTVLVTGANSGLGFASATRFVALDAAKVILAVRNSEAGAEAQRVIAQKTGRPVEEGRTEVWELDMNSFDSVHSFAQRVNRELDCLDTAVLNAGVYKVDYQKSPEGWEETLQVNTLSTVLLAVLLPPKLRESAKNTGNPAVLEVVTSRRVEAVELPPEVLSSLSILKSLSDIDKQNYDSSKQYRISKFLTMCALQKFSSLVNADEVTVTAVCPGAVATNLSRGWTGWLASAVKAVLASILMRTPEYAARTVVSGVLLGREGHGKFWYDDELRR
jgi:NAD(P)-dependent dehydrogenase (short-subunit alcohol dehydrogenase family)